ncbi:MAG: dihydroorotase [Chlamydiota bacterium]
MLTIKNVKLLDGTVGEHTIDSDEPFLIDAEGRLTLLPALIDPHVHFRTPGAEYKENWKSAAHAAVSGGVTCVFDMPNTNPPCTNVENLDAKFELIDKQLEEVEIPLRYHLYYGADAERLETLGHVKNRVVGLKIYMGSSTGGLTMDDPSALDRAFQLAAQHDVIVSVHAEDEEIMKANSEKYKGSNDPSTHSKIRSREAAIKATQQAIDLAEKHGTQLLICHTSTAEEIDMIRKAKKRQLLVYCEVSTHHLFLNESDYDHLLTLALVNPPLRTPRDQEAIWQGIHDGTVDFIGTDHAPHTLEEKTKPYGQAPSGMPGIQTLLPLLLNAYNEKKITLEKIVRLTHINIEQIFGLERNQDFVLVDLELMKEVQVSELKSKCGWSPYAGMRLKGWPIYTILKGKVFHC